jgi:hypothetical protein
MSAPGAGDRIAGLDRGVLLGLLMAALLLPVEVMVAGIRLTPYTLFLLVFILPFLQRFLLERSNRIAPADVLAALYVLWIGLAILFHYGPARIVFVVNQTVMLFGGYLAGRVLVRDAADHERFFRCFFNGLVILSPFVLIEFVTARLVLNDLIGLVVTTIPNAGNHSRLGFFRVQGVFESPILWGMFCSIAVANFFYVFYDGFLRRWSRTGFAAVLTFTSMSSAAVIALGLQLGLILWDRITGALRPKWFVLAYLALMILGLLQLVLPGGILAFVIDNFAFDSNTGWGRTVIFEYGSAEVLRHPLFGIGLGDWVRPWWKKGSVDNFWLLTAMRYGLPALLLLWIALAFHAAAIMRAPLDGPAARYRTGYLIAWAGLFFVLGTVHVWGAPSVFIMVYIGAGAWFYTAGETRAEDPAARRAARRAAAAAAPDPRQRAAPPARPPGPAPAAARRPRVRSLKRPRLSQ